MAAREQLAAQGVAGARRQHAELGAVRGAGRGLPRERAARGVTARVSVEAGITLGWERYAGGSGATVGIDRFGESGKGPAVMAHLGITADNVTREALKLLGK